LFLLDSSQVVNLINYTAQQKKAEKILILDISQISLIADYFIICSGRSTVQVKAIAEEIIKVMGEQLTRAPRAEGLREGNWVLLDYGDIVVHIFQEAERQFYNLERLWGDAKVVDLPAG
jgi:ribosome-associated protein